MAGKTRQGADMWPFPVGGSLWPQGVIGALIAVCAVLALQGGAGAGPAGAYRRPAGWIGWPVVAGLVGTAAYGSVRLLLLALHNSAGLPGYVVTLPDMEPVGLPLAALLMAGLLATALLASTPARRTEGTARGRGGDGRTAGMDVLAHVPLCFLWPDTAERPGGQCRCPLLAAFAGMGLVGLRDGPRGWPEPTR